MKLIIIGLLTLVYLLALITGNKAPEDFSCGSDEICYCDKAKDCIKKK